MDLASEAQPNELLNALLGSTWQHWLPQLEWTDMPLGRVLHQSGSRLSHVYFPATATVSWLYVTRSGSSTEMAAVGNEGMVGIEAFMGGAPMPGRAVVQTAGHGFRMKAATVKAEFDRAGPTAHLLLRYTQALMTQISQLAACNRYHSLDHRLSRWLLWCLDRLQGAEVVMTHELIANLLGVRREGVTEGAMRLRDAGLITYARGHIVVLDRSGLAQRSCECYRVIRLAYDRLLPSPHAEAAPGPHAHSRYPRSRYPNYASVAA